MSPRLLRIVTAFARRSMGPALVCVLFLLLASCASLQRKCAATPWLLCGDRIVVRKDYVYLDDPAYLYNNKTVAFRAGDIYGFRLSLFLNPYRFQSARVAAELRPFRDPSDTAAAPVSGLNAGATAPSPCRIEGGRAEEGKSEVGAVYDRLDSVFAASASERKDRVNLRFLCKDYRPKWGRADTLALRFTGRKAGEDSSSVLLLPFATSFHGPVYSFVIGAALIVSMTAVGEILAAER